MGFAQRGYIAIALAFPIYLLWKNRLTSYLALATTGTAASLTSSQQVMQQVQQGNTPSIVPGGPTIAPVYPLPGTPAPQA